MAKLHPTLLIIATDLEPEPWPERDGFIARQQAEVFERLAEPRGALTYPDADRVWLPHLPGDAARLAARPPLTDEEIETLRARLAGPDLEPTDPDWLPGVLDEFASYTPPHHPGSE